jgi:ornithine carbamoyltransferase
MPRHFLSLTDVTPAQLRALIRRARAFKRNRRLARMLLAGRTIALVFQKPSMRTRVAFEVAVLELGGSVVYLGQDDIRLGTREPVKDVARVISRYTHGVVVRTFAHEDAEGFASFGHVPVINGLSDADHPCQALADLVTMEEAAGRLAGLRAAYVGDGNNVLHSLVQGCAMLGVRLSVATPKAYRPDPGVWNAAQRAARSGGAALIWTDDPVEAVKGAAIVYTDVWVSMGQEAQRAARLKAFRGYQVNAQLLSHAAPRCRVMHCLPAHRGEEVTDDVLEGARSLVLEQAENRLHAHKAILEYLFRGGSR